MQMYTLTPANMVCALSSGIIAHCNEECFKFAACCALIASSPNSAQSIFLVSTAVKEAKSCSLALAGSSMEEGTIIKNTGQSELGWRISSEI